MDATFFESSHFFLFWMSVTSSPVSEVLPVPSLFIVATCRANMYLCKKLNQPLNKLLCLLKLLQLEALRMFLSYHLLSQVLNFPRSSSHSFWPPSAILLRQRVRHCTTYHMTYVSHDFTSPISMLSWSALIRGKFLESGNNLWVPHFSFYMSTTTNKQLNIDEKSQGTRKMQKWIEVELI